MVRNLLAVILVLSLFCFNGRTAVIHFSIIQESEQTIRQSYEMKRNEYRDKINSLKKSLRDLEAELTKTQNGSDFSNILTGETKDSKIERLIKVIQLTKDEISTCESLLRGVDAAETAALSDMMRRKRDKQRNEAILREQAAQKEKQRYEEANREKEAKREEERRRREEERIKREEELRRQAALREQAFQDEMTRLAPRYDRYRDIAAFNASADGLAIAAEAVSPDKYMNPGQANYIPSEAPVLNVATGATLAERFRKRRNETSSVIALRQADSSWREFQRGQAAEYEKIMMLQDESSRKEMELIRQTWMQDWLVQDSLNRELLKDFPFAYESASASCRVYRNDDSTAVRYRPEDKEAFRLLLDKLAVFNDPGNNTDGFYANLYYDKETDTYQFAFRGTDAGNAVSPFNPDGQTNLSNQYSVGPSSQFDKTMEIAVILNGLPDNIKSKMTITGHSLGGALASMAASLTGIKCDTFNAEGIPEPVIAHYVQEYKKITGSKIDVYVYFKENSQNIRAFRSTNDKLTRAQEEYGGVLSRLSYALAFESVPEDGVRVLSVEEFRRIEDRLSGFAPALGEPIEIKTGDGHKIEGFIWRWQ